MLNFHCPFCQTKCETSPEFAGMNMPCPKCGKTITAPGAIAAGEPKMAPSRSQQSGSNDVPAQAPAKGGGNLLLYGIIGIVVVVAIVFVGAMMNSGDGDYKPHHAVNAKNPRVFFDITIGDKPAGRIEMELFA